MIGIVDTGIDPTHPSFAARGQSKAYGPLRKYLGKCEVAPEFPRGSCNGKIIGAQHFAAAAIQSGAFSASYQFASPLDGDGHGRLALAALHSFNLYLYVYTHQLESSSRKLHNFLYEHQLPEPIHVCSS